MDAKKIEIRILLLSVAAIVFLEVAMRLVVSKGVRSPLLVLGMARILDVILMGLMVSVWGKGASSIGLDRGGLLYGFKRGLVWSAGFAAMTSIAFAGILALGANPLTLVRTPVPAEQTERILFFLVGGAIGPLAEEVFFRGILYGFLRRWGVLVGIVVSTGFFVLCHPGFASVPWPQAIGGILFAGAYEVEKSLVTPITIHVLGNLAIFTLSLLP